MKKVLVTAIVCAFLAPMFTACAEKCAKDDDKCIDECINDYAKDKCGVRLDGEVGDYTNKALACLGDLFDSENDINKIGDACIVDYNGDTSFMD